MKKMNGFISHGPIERYSGSNVELYENELVSGDSKIIEDIYSYSPRKDKGFVLIKTHYMDLTELVNGIRSEKDSNSNELFLIKQLSIDKNGEIVFGNIPDTSPENYFLYTEFNDDSKLITANFGFDYNGKIVVSGPLFANLDIEFFNHYNSDLKELIEEHKKMFTSEIKMTKKEVMESKGLVALVEHSPSS